MRVGEMRSWTRRASEPAKRGATVAGVAWTCDSEGPLSLLRNLRRDLFGVLSLRQLRAQILRRVAFGAFADFFGRSRRDHAAAAVAAFGAHVDEVIAALDHV